MKTILFNSIVCLLIIGLFVSCKKEKSDDDDDDENTTKKTTPAKYYVRMKLGDDSMNVADNDPVYTYTNSTHDTEMWGITYRSSIDKSTLGDYVEIDFISYLSTNPTSALFQAVFLEGPYDKEKIYVVLNDGTGALWYYEKTDQESSNYLRINSTSYSSTNTSYNMNVKGSFYLVLRNESDQKKTISGEYSLPYKYSW